MLKGPRNWNELFYRYDHPSKSIPEDKNDNDPIPSEIYFAILQLLSKPELATCLRVSRSVHLLAQPLLYRAVSVNMKEHPDSFGQEVMPSKKGLRRFVAWVKTSNSDGDILASKGKAGKYKGLVMGVGYLRPKEDMNPGRINKKADMDIGYSFNPPYRFSYTTHLTLSSHTTRTCLNRSPIIMTNLHTLQLLPNILVDDDISFSQCHRHKKHKEDIHTPLCTCPLISLLRPRKLILGTCDNAITEPSMGLWASLPTYPPIWLKELVIHAGYWAGIDIGHGDTSTSMGKNPVALEKLTIILENGGGEKAKELRMKYITSHGAIPLDKLWNKVLTALEGEAGITEVIGIRDLGVDWTGKDVRRVEEGVARMELAERLYMKGNTQKEAERMIGRLELGIMEG